MLGLESTSSRMSNLRGRKCTSPFFFAGRLDASIEAVWKRKMSRALRKRSSTPKQIASVTVLGQPGKIQAGRERPGLLACGGRPCWRSSAPARVAFLGLLASIIVLNAPEGIPHPSPVGTVSRLDRVCHARRGRGGAVTRP